MRAIIIDDEKMALELLGILLSKFNEVELVGSYCNPMQALVGLPSLKVDVVFLDIEMGDIYGIEFAEKLLLLQEDLEIVFVTAYSQYAVDAFELNVIDYLLKPISEERLQKSIGRVQNKLAKKKQEKKTGNLYIQSFGSFEVFDSEGKPMKWRTQKNKELLAYLWFHENRRINKNIILDTIFMDHDIEKATTLLHTTVYQLRKSLRNLGLKNPIRYSNEAYELNVNFKSDYADFLELTQKEEATDADIEQILALYQDDFFGVDGYFWAMGEQKHIQNQFVEFLIQYSEKRLKEENYSSLLKNCLDTIYSKDPFHQRAATLLLSYYDKIGDSAGLINFYKTYEMNCKRVLGMEPSQQTQALYNRLINNHY